MKKSEYISASKDSGTSDGSTTSDYVNALIWICDILTRKHILLKNTHATNDLKYKVLVYAFVDGIEYTEVAETTLAAGDVAKIVLNYSYSQVLIPVKDAISGTMATYTINYTGIKG